MGFNVQKQLCFTPSGAIPKALTHHGIRIIFSELRATLALSVL
jgi:hypothetical protein